MIYILIEINKIYCKYSKCFCNKYDFLVLAFILVPTKLPLRVKQYRKYRRLTIPKLFPQHIGGIAITKTDRKFIHHSTHINLNLYWRWKQVGRGQNWQLEGIPPLIGSLPYIQIIKSSYKPAPYCPNLHQAFSFPIKRRGGRHSLELRPYNFFPLILITD